MSDFPGMAYPWIKAFHVMAVIAWMAGIFYLPRLFVYHAEEIAPGSREDRLFQTMEAKLERLIMRPAMIATWLAGATLAATPGVVDWSEAWPWVKGGGVLAMTWFHFWLWRRRIEFGEGRNTRSGRTYRLMNEVPTLLMAAIVISVIVRF